MAKKSSLSDEDKQLFRRNMVDVKPLIKTRVLSRRKPGKARLFVDEIQPDRPSKGFSTGYESAGPVLSEYRQPGLSTASWRTFRKKGRVEGELDLHGLTVQQAAEILSTFLQCAANRQWRVVKIIHGKGYGSIPGQPRLKDRVNQWLQDSDRVLGFYVPDAKEGGGGVLVVLLKKDRLDADVNDDLSST